MSAIITYLSELPRPAAEKALSDELKLIERCSDDCLKYAQTITEAFEEWFKLVCEVRDAAVIKEEQASMAWQKNKVLVTGVRLGSEMTESSLKKANETAKEMKEQMAHSRQLLEKAAGSVSNREHSLTDHVHTLF
jgi:hypothetical protein